MAKENFAPSLAAVLVHEGGYSNHPDDPGGPTMKGVIKRVYDDYRRSKGLPARDVRQITDDELEEIYRRRYWDLIQGDRLPAGVDYVVFDGCVNSGAGQATKWLQRALGVTADGVLGPATLAALARVEDHDALIAGIQSRRLTMLKALKTWPVFGKGWGRRVEECRILGQAIAGGSVELPMPAGSAPGKAYAASVKSPPPKEIGAMLGAGGTVGTSLTMAAETLTPLADKSAFAGTVLTYIAAASAVVALAGLVWRQWAAARERALADAVDALPADPAAPAAVWDGGLGGLRSA